MIGGVELGSVADYQGRTVDVLAYRGQTLAGEARLLAALAGIGDGGLVCTGVQKLAQRWLVEFLTPAGSLQYLPARGCDLPNQLRRGELRTALDAEQAFHLSAHQVRLNLLAEEDDTMPDDERLGEVVLNTLGVVGDALTVTVTVASRAGGTARAILPVAVKIN